MEVGFVAVEVGDGGGEVAGAAPRFGEEKGVVGFGGAAGAHLEEVEPVLDGGDAAQAPCGGDDAFGGELFPRGLGVELFHQSVADHVEFDAAFVHVDDVFGGAEAVGDGVHGDGGLSGWGRGAGGEEGIGPVGGDAAERGHGKSFLKTEAEDETRSARRRKVARRKRRGALMGFVFYSCSAG